jgi:hypothetical protein
VAADGLYSKLAPAVGIDSWQALMLAVRLLEDLLSTEVERGAILHWPDDTAAVSLARLFGRASSD